MEAEPAQSTRLRTPGDTTTCNLSSTPARRTFRTVSFELKDSLYGATGTLPRYSSTGAVAGENGETVTGDNISSQAPRCGKSAMGIMKWPFSHTGHVKGALVPCFACIIW
jgi:hypothetical protein